MRKNLIPTFLIAVFIASCSIQTKQTSEFPMEEGTTWVYSYETYEPSASDPSQIVRATYQLTEAIVETEFHSSYFIAHMTKEYNLVNADNGWRGWYVDSLSKESWYVVNGQNIYESPLFDINNIDENRMELEYIFPLAVDNRWCQMQQPPCTTVGWRMVTGQSHYESPVGEFDNCYEMRDIYNGGGLFHTFCLGIGIVEKKYDHIGTNFGFEQNLINYSAGVP